MRVTVGGILLRPGTHVNGDYCVVDGTIIFHQRLNPRMTIMVDGVIKKKRIHPSGNECVLSEEEEIVAEVLLS